MVLPARAVYTEIGISYNYKKVTFDANDNIESQGTTASIALYAWEKIAFELAYTNGLLVKKELQLAPPSTAIRTTVQNSNIYEFNIQYLLTSDRKAIFQPYIKAGVAYIVKTQQVQIDQGTPFDATPPAGWGPSGGVGLRIFFTDNLSLRVSYDVVQTPIDGGTTANDVTGRAGISWLF
jgi:outer membrane protein W